MASLGTHVVASPKTPSTCLHTLEVFYGGFFEQTLEVAPTAGAWTDMATTQIRAARNRAPVRSFVHILVAAHWYRMVAVKDSLIDNDHALYNTEIFGRIAVHVILKMTTREFHVVQYNHTSSAIFSASCLLARMAARLMSALATLFAFKDFMHRLGMAPRLASMSTVWKTVRTSFSAASLRA